MLCRKSNHLCKISLFLPSEYLPSYIPELIGIIYCHSAVVWNSSRIMIGSGIAVIFLPSVISKSKRSVFPHDVRYLMFLFVFITLITKDGHFFCFIKFMFVGGYCIFIWYLSTSIKIIIWYCFLTLCPDNVADYVG